MSDLSKAEQQELRRAALEYARVWGQSKLNASVEMAHAMKKLHTAARAFAAKTDAEWAAEVAVLRDALRDLRSFGVEAPAAETEQVNAFLRRCDQLVEGT